MSSASLRRCLLLPEALVLCGDLEKWWSGGALWWFGRVVVVYGSKKRGGVETGSRRKVGIQKE